MDPALVFKVLFYTAKIIRISLIIGIFEALRRSLQVGGGKSVNSTRLQTAGGAG